MDSPIVKKYLLVKNRSLGRASWQVPKASRMILQKEVLMASWLNCFLNRSNIPQSASIQVKYLILMADITGRFFHAKGENKRKEVHLSEKKRIFVSVLKRIEVENIILAGISLQQSHSKS